MRADDERLIAVESRPDCGIFFDASPQTPVTEAALSGVQETGCQPLIIDVNGRKCDD